MTTVENVFAAIVLLGMFLIFAPSCILPFFPKTLKELGLKG